MTTRFRCGDSLQIVHALLAAALIAGSVASTACSQQGSAEQLNAPVLITTRQTVIAFQNRAGVPLNDIKLTVVAYGNTEFTRMLGRMDTEESREVNLNQLSSRDGTSFNARLSKPKLVRFTATDVNGKPVEFEVPWK
jgi:hypothetical protein